MAKSEKTQNKSVQEPSLTAGFIRMTLNWSIAGISIAVIGGFGYWAISLGARNPNEVPIIRAMEGPARVQPENPGGKQASHQGLAVNTVQAEGGVQAPSQQVALAPAPQQLNDEDIANAKLAPRIKPLLKVAKVETETSAADLIAKAITQDQAQAKIAMKPSQPRIIVGTAYSPKASLRPATRPTQLTAQLAQVQQTSAGSPPSKISQTVPLGTRLIQLGAYDSTAQAIKQWDKLFAKHGDLLEGKKRLVQAAESGGRKFFRLRATGFASKDETRTLCSALLARGTPCIPVTAR